MFRTGFTWLFLLFIAFSLNAQVVINEASNKNFKQIIDEDGDYNDWIELYNSDVNDINLTGWALSDSKKAPVKWKFGKASIPAGGFIAVFASGKDRDSIEEAENWKSAVLPTDLFSYTIPSALTPNNWYKPDFDDASWSKGKAGFGYADNDDRTILPEQTISVYIRREFDIPDTTAILGAIFNADYDDGFIAYLNGVEIARANMEENPQWNSLATGNHEAVMYSGGTPDAFEIDIKSLKSIIRQGQNVLCVQAHNNSTTSTDFSIIPYLSFSLTPGNYFFQPSPTWLGSNSEQKLHTNFKLSSEGEKLYLSHNGIVVDSMNVPKMMVDQSFGRITDGVGQLGIFVTATPGASNNTSVAYTQGYAATPVLSNNAGFYKTAIDVSITISGSNSTVRYTIDGSEPTESSTVYSSPIRIGSTKCLKARCFSTGKLPGEVVTATYLINQEFELPVLSVTTNNDNLYGNQGIFDNINESWNIPSFIEYFEKDEQLAFSQWAGMQLDGGAGGSRSNAQHSFRIEPGNSTFGDGNLKYKLMHRRPNRDNFPSFYLRNGSNQHLTLPYKDALEVTALGRNTFTYYSAYHPVVVFINGGYFGVYKLREKVNGDYLEDNYNMDIDSLDFLGMSYFKGTLNGGDMFSAISGSIDPFLADVDKFRAMNPQSANYLTEVGKFLDIQCYTDYIIAEDWVGNNDWPNNNIKLFRCKGTNFRWQWAINDLEWALAPNPWTTADFDHLEYMNSIGTSNYFTGFWYNMMQNSIYKAYFINRFADLMNTNYLFSQIGPLENEMFNEIYPEMDGEFTRWRSSTNMSSQLNTFTNNHTVFRSELSRRSDIVRSQLQSHYNLSKQVTVTLDVEPREAGSIQISTIIPASYPWEGIYFTNTSISVTALPNPGYRFTGWNSNNFCADQYNATNTGKLSGSAVSLKAFFEPEENSEVGVVISEINYKSAKGLDNPDWIEFCNLSRDEVNLNGWYFTDEDSGHIFTFDRDLLLMSKQRIVVSNDYNLFKYLNPSVTVFAGEFTFGFNVPDDKVNLYNSNDELISSVHYSDNYPWALSNDFSGRSLELRSAGGEPNQSATWFRGCIGGSPGIAYQPCGEEVVSTPVMVATNSFDVKVYPVPARDFLNVDIQLDEESENCIVSLYNSMGNLVKSISPNNVTIGWNRLTISLDDVAGNMLFLRVSTSRSEKTVKILRQ